MAIDYKPIQILTGRRGGSYTGMMYPCAGCGVPFWLTPHLYGKGRRYCKTRCFYDTRIGQTPSTLGYTLTCPNCGGAFEPFNRAQRFCDHKCATQAWHKNATDLGLCHSCGRPSAPDYRNACVDHADRIKVAQSAGAKKRLQARKASGLCTSCGKPMLAKGQVSLACGRCGGLLLDDPDDIDFLKCWSCGRGGPKSAIGKIYDLTVSDGSVRCLACKQALNATNRHKRRVARDGRLKEISDQGLVSVVDAADILDVHSSFLYLLLGRGDLHVETTIRGRGYLTRQEVEEYKAVKMIASYYQRVCADCDHRWIPQDHHTYKVGKSRCPKCRSLQVRQHNTIPAFGLIDEKMLAQSYIRRTREAASTMPAG